MTKRAIGTDERIPRMTVSLIDLRAHFEAQLRTVIRAEQTLLRCRKTRDPAAFEASMNSLRHHIRIVSDNNRIIRGVIDQLDGDARASIC
jgi:hypothetical protein